ELFRLAFQRGDELLWPRPFEDGTEFRAFDRRPAPAGMWQPRPIGIAEALGRLPSRMPRRSRSSTRPMRSDHPPALGGPIPRKRTGSGRDLDLDSLCTTDRATGRSSERRLGVVLVERWVRRAGKAGWRVVEAGGAGAGGGGGELPGEAHRRLAAPVAWQSVGGVARNGAAGQ